MMQAETKTVNLRGVPGELVRQAKMRAASEGLTLKDFFIVAVRRALRIKSDPENAGKASRASNSSHHPQCSCAICKSKKGE